VAEQAAQEVLMVTLVLVQQAEVLQAFGQALIL
jgi:hypothetical protein